MKKNPFRAMLSLQVLVVDCWSHRRYFEIGSDAEAEEYAKAHLAGRQWRIVSRPEQTPCWAF